MSGPTPGREAGEPDMPGRSSSYDPVQVTPLGEEQGFAMRDAAPAAIAGAAGPEAPRRAGTEPGGDGPRLGLATREIGALPPQARKDAGLRVGKARGAVNEALAARAEVLEVEAEE